MKFKEKLRELREQAGLTQRGLAEKAGLTLHSVRNHEQGQRLPSWLAVVKLARALGVPTDAFADCVLAEEPHGAENAKGKAPVGRPRGSRGMVS